MHNVKFSRRALAWIVSLVMLMTLLPVSAFAADESEEKPPAAETSSETGTIGDTDTGLTEEPNGDGNDTNSAGEPTADGGDADEDIVADTDDNSVKRIILHSDDETASDKYYLMNIPYAEFYKAIGTTANSTNYDAISSATNKVGNYSKSGGAFHSETSALVDGDSVTAVGGENGAKNEGVIWPVKASSANITSLGGSEIEGTATKTIATLGRGQTSASYLYGYECLTEAPVYSYYQLDAAPANYLEMSGVSGGKPILTAGERDAVKKSDAAVTPSYGTNWGDVQLGISGISDVESALVNAVVITTKDGDDVGLVHLYNVWSANDIAWKVATVSGLDGTEITNIRYYCSVKDDSVGEGNSEAPAYENYIYDYSVSDLEIPQVYTEEITARFTSDGNIMLTGLPEDVQNPQAKVYHNAGGRPAVLTYLTPLEVDPADQDIDPVNVEIVNGKITISPTLVTVTNANGDSQSYGQPIDGTEYTVEISSDNWIIAKTTAQYTANNPSSNPGSGYPGGSSGGSHTVRPSGSSSNTNNNSSNSSNKNSTSNVSSDNNDSRYNNDYVIPSSTPSSTSKFTDVTVNDWYYSAVQYVQERGLMDGVGRGRFVGESNLSRAQLAQILYNISGKPVASSSISFTDVPVSEWYFSAVAWASQNGIVSGYSNGAFGPNDNITREQLAVMLWRFAGQPVSGGTLNFSDAPLASGYAVQALCWAVENGILSGYSNGNLASGGLATRAEVASMIMRFCENVA